MATLPFPNNVMYNEADINRLDRKQRLLYIYRHNFNYKDDLHILTQSELTSIKENYCYHYCKNPIRKRSKSENSYSYIQTKKKLCHCVNSDINLCEKRNYLSMIYDKTLDNPDSEEQYCSFNPHIYGNDICLKNKKSIDNNLLRCSRIDHTQDEVLQHELSNGRITTSWQYKSKLNDQKENPINQVYFDINKLCAASSELQPNFYKFDQARFKTDIKSIEVPENKEISSERYNPNNGVETETSNKQRNFNDLVHSNSEYKNHSHCNGYTKNVDNAVISNIENNLIKTDTDIINDDVLDNKNGYQAAMCDNSACLIENRNNTYDENSDNNKKEKYNELQEKLLQSSPVPEETSIFSSNGKSIEIIPTFISSGDITSLAPHPGLRLSLFPNVPPYILFSTHNKKDAISFPTLLHRHLRWKISSITPIVVRQIISNSGFRLVKLNTGWCGTWNKYLKSVNYKTIYEHQKMNHFPGTFQIGRKDRLWRNINKCMTKFGEEEFGFMPATYILPYDMKCLRSAWGDTGSEKWIVKPPASARGVGIKVIHQWSQIPRKTMTIVQKYISDPFLINDTKFDLRLYVLVTSFNPLRIYLYDNGLVRFASVKYSAELNTLSDIYMHLTNYSVNKLSNGYMPNENAEACEGHKWTVKTLWNYLQKEHDVNIDELQKRLIDLVAKTILSAESPINKFIDSSRNSRYNCYELFGIDVLFDQQLKPWLLEVNISPSLHSSSPLDIAVKGPLIQNLFNMVGFHIPASKKISEEDFKKLLGEVEHPVCYDKRLYVPQISPAEKAKQQYFEEVTSRDKYLESILTDLTPDDVRHLIQYEDELTQVGSFQRIFPTCDTHNYFKFFDYPKYYNYLLDAWETKYHSCREKGIELLRIKCLKGVHLDVSLVNTSTVKICKIHQKYQLHRKIRNNFRYSTNRNSIMSSIRMRNDRTRADSHYCFLRNDLTLKSREKVTFYFFPFVITYLMIKLFYIHAVDTFFRLTMHHN